MTTSDIGPLKLVKVSLPLDPSEWHGNASETVWAAPITSASYRIDNTPFYFFGLSYGDIVLAAPDVSGQLIYQAVCAHSGHSTYRLMLNKAHPERFERAWKALEALGCRGERGPGRIFAVDIPAQVDVYAVYSLFEAGECARIWDFEEGHCGHPIQATS